LRHLPNAERAEIDLRKLRDYVLDPSHLRGRHKARVFGAALGLEQRDAAWLAAAIRATLPAAMAVEESADGWGERWRSDHVLEREGNWAIVRCLWLIRSPEAAPRLITCYVRR
jgi:hypothetical protein